MLGLSLAYDNLGIFDFLAAVSPASQPMMQKCWLPQWNQ
jgi:hypothetical protein